MSKPDQLYRTTIVIWTDYDPSHREIDALAAQAMYGDAYCSEQHTEEVTDQTQFPETEFFDDPDGALPRYYACPTCEQYHPLGFSGDCRDDDNRFAAGELDEKHGPDGWIEQAEFPDEDTPHFLRQQAE